MYLQVVWGKLLMSSFLLYIVLYDYSIWFGCFSSLLLFPFYFSFSFLVNRGLFLLTKTNLFTTPATDQIFAFHFSSLFSWFLLVNRSLLLLTKTTLFIAPATNQILVLHHSYLLGGSFFHDFSFLIFRG